MENGGNGSKNGVYLTLRIDAKTIGLLLTLTGSGWAAFFFGDYLKPRYEPREVHQDIGAQILDALPSYTYNGRHYWMKDGRPTLAGLELHMQLLPGTLDRKGLTRDIAWELFVTQRALLERRQREREKPTKP